MDEIWHTYISRDLERVESVMGDAMRSKNPELTEMCNYVVQSHGKRVRPSMCILTYYACGGTESKRAVDVGAAIELIHNATLIHDDINDLGELRRGRKTLYKQYSLGKSIVAGDFMFAIGFQLIGASIPKIVEFVVEASSAMGAGEFDQKDFEHRVNVTESDYMNIIDGKTAKLIECAAKAGSYLADQDMEVVDSVGEFAHMAGMAFQIVDDTLDVIGDERTLGKTTGSDIMEGKPTLPIIYAMQDPKYGGRLKEIFEKENVDHSDVKEAIGLIIKTDAISRCRAKARSLIADSAELLKNIEDSVYKRALMNMVEYIVSRDR